MRLIARLNIGGPAIQTIHLTKALNNELFCSLLATGFTADGEGEMDYLVKKAGIEPVRIKGLYRAMHPVKDLYAFIRILKLVFNYKPNVIHTHTAKAGALGRLAGIVYRVVTGHKVKLVHTYHGHVFLGYFGPFKTGLYLAAERILARQTDRLLVLSQSQYKEICYDYKVGKPEQFQVLPLGLELAEFKTVENKDRRGEFRQQYGVDKEILVGIVGRLTGVKNHHLFLEMARRLIKRNSGQMRFLIIGDGELRPVLEVEVDRLGLKDYVFFAGWQQDMRWVYQDLDVVALTSNNEGTPVTLIEAMAAARPVISTRVGGVADLLGQATWNTRGFAVAERGVLAHPQDAEGLVSGTEWLLSNPKQAVKLACEGRNFIQRFTLDRLVSDVGDLYQNLFHQEGEVKI